MWRAESEGVRRHFEQLAQEEKRRHALMYPEYRYAPKKVPVSGLLPASVPAITRARDASSRCSIVSERIRAAQPPATPPTLARPSTKKSRQEPKVVALPSPLPSPTVARSQAILIDDDSDDELEYDFEDEDDEDMQPWDSLFSNVIPSSSSRRSPVSISLSLPHVIFIDDINPRFSLLRAAFRTSHPTTTATAWISTIPPTMIAYLASPQPPSTLLSLALGTPSQLTVE